MVVEVNQGLDAQVGLKFPKARTWWGLLTRLAAKLAAFNVSLVLNHAHNHPAFAHLTPFA